MKGVSWPSIDSDSIDSDSEQLKDLHYNLVSQFYLVDANGNLRFEIAGITEPEFEVEFTKLVESLLAEMGHKIVLVDRASQTSSSTTAAVNSFAGISWKVKKDIFNLIKSNDRIDDKSMKTLALNHDLHLPGLLALRNLLAVQTNHPQALEFARELATFDNETLLNEFAWKCYEFSQEFDIGPELSAACLDISKRSVELDSNPNSLVTCAHWLAYFPDRIDEAIEMQEKAIKLVKKLIDSKEYHGPDDKLAQYEAFLKELEAK